jgi:MoaA/NifB/PqqE/SkfB family radical SAM enzyme
MGTVLFTNGSKIDENICHFLFDNDVSVLVKQLSMDYERQDIMIGRRGMSLRMRGGLEILMKTKREREQAGRKTSTTGIECYVSKENIDDVSEILRYCRKNDLHPYIESFITMGQSDETLKLAPTQMQLNSLFEWLVKIDKEEFGIEVTLEPDSPRYGGSPCIKGKASFAVHTDGSVYECVSGSHEFGNIRQQDIREILSVRNPKVKNFYSGRGVCESCCLLYQK